MNQPHDGLQWVKFVSVVTSTFVSAVTTIQKEYSTLPQLQAIMQR